MESQELTISQCDLEQDLPQELCTYIEQWCPRMSQARQTNDL
jgi:hypothetical protein